MKGCGWVSMLPLIMASFSAAAASDEVLLNASAGVFYDSNRTLAEDDKTELTGTYQRARIGYQSETETTTFTSAFSGVEEQLQDYENSENDSVALSLEGTGNFERSNLYGSVLVQQDTTLATEVRAAGLSSENKDRTYTTATGGYGYRLTPRDQFDVGVSAEHADYDDIRSSQLAEYIYYGVNTGYSRSLSETGKLQLQIYESILDNERSGMTHDTTGVRANWNQQLTAVWRMKAGMGARKSAYEVKWQTPAGRTATYSDSNWGRVTDLELAGDGEILKSRWFASYDLAPSSGGNLVARQSIGGSLYRPWSSTHSTAINFQFWKQRSEVEISADEDLESLQATISHEWRFFRKMNVVFRYSRIERELTQLGVAAHSDFAGLEIAWIEDPLSILL